MKLKTTSAVLRGIAIYSFMLSLSFVAGADLIFKVTYRDFLPAGCNYVLDPNTGVPTQLGRDRINEAWDFPQNDADYNLDKLSDKKNCQKLTQTWKDDFVLTDTIIGHPDMAANGVKVSLRWGCEREGTGIPGETCEDGDSCQGTGTNCLNFPVCTCLEYDAARNLPRFKNDSSIIKRELKVATSGLPKPEYCDETGRCGFIYRQGRFRYTQSNKTYFDLWYNDNPAYNKRVGQLLKLRDIGASKFLYDSDNAADNENFQFGPDIAEDFFGPLDRFKQSGNPYEVISDDYDDDPFQAPAWPQTAQQSYSDPNGATQDKGFWVTTELHATFEYRRNKDMVFEFSGDDDFWCFINGKMAIDLGGTHPKLEARIDLNANIANYQGQVNVPVYEILELEDGQVYTLDIFHAERNQQGSNFKVTTSLFPACNVFEDGVGTVAFNSSSMTTEEEFSNTFQSSSLVEFNAGLIQMGNPSSKFSSYYVYTKRQENIGRGFISKFKVRIPNEMDGFAFVVQKQGLENYPISGYPHFNFKNVKESFAIVFDLCAERGVNGECNAQNVRLHYPNSPNETNIPRDETRRVYDNIIRKMARDESISIEIVYYGGKPEFLEVFIDDSLYLRQSGFKPQELIGSLGAHIGITSTSSNIASDLFISEWTLTTVEVDPTKTEIVENFANQDVIADGVSISAGYTIRTFDGCGNNLTTGTLADLLDAIYVEKPGENNTYSGGELTPEIIPATIIDNDDGTYTAALITTIAAEYSIYYVFGEGCELDYTDINNIFVSGGPDCSDLFSVLNASLAIPVPTEAPTGPGPNLQDDDNSELIQVASISGGVLSFLMLVAAFMFVRYRRRWLKDKVFVKDGEQYILDLETNYNTADEISSVTQQVIATQAAIIRHEKQGNLDPKTQSILNLKNQNDEIKEQNRVKKKQLEQIKHQNSTKSSKSNMKKKIKKAEFDL